MTQLMATPETSLRTIPTLDRSTCIVAGAAKALDLSPHRGADSLVQGELLPIPQNVFFFLIKFTDAGDDAPSQKKKYHTSRCVCYYKGR